MQEYSDSQCSFDPKAEQWYNPNTWELCDYETYVKNRLPSNSSWDNPERYHSAYLDYEEAKTRLIDTIDTQYKFHPDTHIVIYTEKYTNDLGDYWLMYMLR